MYTDTSAAEISSPPISVIPHELMFAIFNHLQPRDILSFSAVEWTSIYSYLSFALLIPNLFIFPLIRLANNSTLSSHPPPQFNISSSFSPLVFSTIHSPTAPSLNWRTVTLGFSTFDHPGGLSLANTL